jgi:hypothetical protein
MLDASLNQTRDDSVPAMPWLRSSLSLARGGCVEVALLGDGWIGIRKAAGTLCARFADPGCSRPAQRFRAAPASASIQWMRWSTTSRSRPQRAESHGWSSSALLTSAVAALSSSALAAIRPSLIARLRRRQVRSRSARDLGGAAGRPGSRPIAPATSRLTWPPITEYVTEVHARPADGAQQSGPLPVTLTSKPPGER